jgi:DNA-binding NtrC family response regulator
MSAPVVLVLVDDDAVRGAIRFALDVEGMGVEVFASLGEMQRAMPGAASCLVIDDGPDGPDMLATLEMLRGGGMSVPTVILATTPSADYLDSAHRLNASVVEKPLLCDELVTEIRRLSSGKARQ